MANKLTARAYLGKALHRALIQSSILGQHPKDQADRSQTGETTDVGRHRRELVGTVAESARTRADHHHDRKAGGRPTGLEKADRRCQAAQLDRRAKLDARGAGVFR
jgi:hypothetical protein